MNVCLKRLAIRCPYPGPYNGNRTEVKLAVKAIARLHTISTLSLTGSLLNNTSVKVLGEMPFLETLVIVGGPIEHLHGSTLVSTSFRTLRTLILRYIDDYHTSEICSIQSIMSTLWELTIEWDWDTEPGFAGIDDTFAAISCHCPTLRQLKLELHENVSVRQPHYVPGIVWQAFYSDNVESITLLGVCLAYELGSALTEALLVTWPNLHSLVAPCQVLSRLEMEEIKGRSPRLLQMTHASN
jgi:hypothetical protein